MSAKLRVKRSGPYEVQGLVEVERADGSRVDVTDRPRVLLCGCGHSRNRPFCDGSHHAHPPAWTRDDDEGG